MYEPKLRRRNNGLPIMSNAEIDYHVERFLGDYQSSLLTTPQPVDIEEFAEIYLDLSLDYVYLSQCGLILGRMVFQDVEMVPVYLPKEKCADYLYAERGTMLIDNTVLEDFKEYRLRSTIGHECGHWVFHSNYCTFADFYVRQGLIKPFNTFGCTKTDIEGGADKRKFVSDLDWLEHQAKYFSAAILMPKTSFTNAVKDLMGGHNVTPSRWSSELSKVFQVSPLSANIRLSQLGLAKYDTVHGGQVTDYRRHQALCE